MGTPSSRKPALTNPSPASGTLCRTPESPDSLSWPRQHHCGCTPLTLLQPEPDVLLASVDALRGLGAHVAEVGAQQAPLAEVDGDVHVQVLQAPHLLGLPHRPWVLLRGEEEPLPPGLRMLCPPLAWCPNVRQAKAGGV